MDAKAREKAGGSRASKGVKGESTMVAWRPRVRGWWQEARNEGLLAEWEGWGPGEDVRQLLEPRIIQCLTGTETLGQLLGGG